MKPHEQRWLLLASGFSVLAAAILLREKPSASATETPRPARTAVRSSLDDRLTSGKPLSEADRRRVTKIVAKLFTNKINPNNKINLAELTEDELYTALQNETLPTQTLRHFAKELASRITDTAWAGITQLSEHPNKRLRAIIAEAIGFSSHSEAKTLIEKLLGDADSDVVQGAIRGLGHQGNPDAINSLNTLLVDPSYPATTRTTAALALAGVNSPEASTRLIEALKDIDNFGIRKSVVEALGQKPFSETEQFFRSYLSTTGISAELRIAALEAVADADGEVSSLLLDHIRDSAPQVRASAAWGLTMTEPHAGAGEILLGLLTNERNSEVRTRLYQALLTQEDFDFTKLMPTLENETSVGARLAAYNLWAGQCETGGQTDIAARFDQIAVPELRRISLQESDLNSGLTAVIALRRAGSPSAKVALQATVRESSIPQVVKAAQSALASIERRRKPH